MSFLEDIRAITDAEHLKESNLPSGDYGLTIVKIVELVLKKERQNFDKVFPAGTKYTMVLFKPSSIVAVDEAELDQCQDWELKTIPLNIFDSDTMKKSFIPLIGQTGGNIQDYITGDGFDLDQVYKNLINKKVLGHVERTYNEEKDKHYVNLRSTAKMPE